MSRSKTDSRSSVGSRMAVLGVAAVASTVVALALFGGGDPDGAGAGSVETGPSGFAYQVGDPGPGAVAPRVALPSTTGAFDLTEREGERILLYFQEGLMCQPCWDQLTELERRWPDVAALGIDGMVTITTDPADALAQKVAIEGIDTPVLADPDRAVSSAYSTTDYGMMGGNYNGHTFIVVGPDGTIEWRADYGGAPDYTMYLPVDALLKDLRAGLDSAA